MALPAFLKKTKDVKAASDSEPVVRKPDDGAVEYDGLESAMQELGGHLASKDWAKAAECFRSAMQICDSESYEEMSTDGDEA
jgi:hypothetical protein